VSETARKKTFKGVVSIYIPNPATIQILTSICAQIEEQRLALDLVGGIAQETLMVRTVVEDSNRKNEQGVNLKPIVEEVEGAGHFVDGDDAVGVQGRRRSESQLGGVKVGAAARKGMLAPSPILAPLTLTHHPSPLITLTCLVPHACKPPPVESAVSWSA